MSRSPSAVVPPTDHCRRPLTLIAVTDADPAPDPAPVHDGSLGRRGAVLSGLLTDGVQLLPELEVVGFEELRQAVDGETDNGVGRSRH